MDTGMFSLVLPPSEMALVDASANASAPIATFPLLLIVVSAKVIFAFAEWTLACPERGDNSNKFKAICGRASNWDSRGPAIFPPIPPTSSQRAPDCPSALISTSPTSSSAFVKEIAAPRVSIKIGKRPWSPETISFDLLRAISVRLPRTLGSELLTVDILSFTSIFDAVTLTSSPSVHRPVGM